MRPVVVFPDAAATAITHLNAVLTPSVFQTIPATRPATFVTVVRTGGAELNVVVDDALLAVDCWASTHEAAHDLAQLARAHLLSLRGDTVNGVLVYRVNDAGGPQLFPDPVSDQPRYRATVAMAVRGTSL